MQSDRVPQQDRDQSSAHPQPLPPYLDSYRDLVEHSRDLMCLHDLKGRLLSMNPVPARILGYEPSELVGANIRELLPAEKRALFDDYLQAVVRNGAASGIMQVMTRAGERRLWEYHNTLRNQGVSEPIVRGMAHDITERWRAERALRRSEERFATVFQACPIGIVIARFRDGRIEDVNASFEKITGYCKEELVGRTAGEIGLWNDPQDRQALWSVLAAKSCVQGGSGRLRNKAGGTRLVSYSAALVQLQEERYAFAFVHDVTERQATEERLRQAQRMEALSLMASGCAHDFNNFLTGILGNAQMIPRNGPLPPEVLERISLIEESALRARELTAQLHMIAGDNKPQAKPMNWNDCITGLRHILASTVGEHINLVLSLEPNLWSMKANPTQMKQVLCNLVTNGSEVMPQGGTLQISTSNIEVADPDRANPALLAGRYVKLSVTDSGQGMDAETVARVFEPFFTTRTNGSGRGLGLSAVYSIVKQAGGYTCVQSEPGRGSTFEIFLPATNEDLADKAMNETNTPEESMCRGTILVVDDSPTVRQVAVEALEAHGYGVVAAHAAEEALQIVRSLAGQIDLLVTDLVMPGMSGLELSERVARDWPRVKVLFLSGYDGARIVPKTGTQLKYPLLQKPFLMNELLAHVSCALST